ncbi:MAG TPA: transmembrane 220 family protein [Kofleriaceae bacterium]|nr:transmembrane 220 family protein [Kofleriaceae bacterium]
MTERASGPGPRRASEERGARARSRWLLAVNALLALGFAAAAAVQWNDPDPAPWIAIYGAAALACALAGRVRWAWLVAAAVAAASIVWGAWIASGVGRAVPVGDLFRPMEMKGGPVEETREALGLALVALWMIALVVLERRAAAREKG